MANELYVAVGTADALHSGVWKAWSQGDEFYAISVAGMSPYAKVSVHRTGVCRLANVEDPEVQGWDRDPDPRVIQRWRIAEVGTEDYTVCLALLVPAIFVPDRLGLPDWLPERTRRRIVWLEPAPLAYATLVEFVRTPDASRDQLRPGDDEPLGVFDLRSGSRVWAFARRQALAMDALSFWQREVTRAVADVAAPVRNGEVFSTISSPANWSAPLMRDVALGLGNFRYKS